MQHEPMGNHLGPTGPKINKFLKPASHMIYLALEIHRRVGIAALRHAQGTTK